VDNDLEAGLMRTLSEHPDRTAGGLQRTMTCKGDE